MNVPASKKLVVAIDLTAATLPANISEKYARKLLQDYLKANSMYKGGWECWLEKIEDGKYHFEISNRYRRGV